MFETVSSSFGCRMETCGTYDHLLQSEQLVFSPCIRLSQKQEVPPASSRLIPAWIPKGWRTHSDCDSLQKTKTSQVTGLV